MANIETRDQATIVSNEVVAMQAASQTPLDFSAGSILLAAAQAVAAVALWLQGMILQLLTLTRALTSVGTDLDSWMGDFSFIRLPGVTATGTVTFSRFTTTGQALVPPGTLVQTADGTQVFAVLTDTSNPAWNAPLGAYVMGSSVGSVDVSVQARTAGSGGNVLAHTITTIGQSLAGVDTVDNAAAFTNALDAEKDADFRARFINYINSLSKATAAAIDAAINNVQQGLTETLTERQTYGGALQEGFFYAVVDDGSGDPPDALMDRVSTAVNAVRACGIQYAVFEPVITTVAVSMSIHVAAGYDSSTVAGAVGTALTNALNAKKLQESLTYTSVAGIAYSVPGVANVTSVLVNSGTSDITVDQQHVLKAGLVTVNTF